MLLKVVERLGRNNITYCIIKRRLMFIWFRIGTLHNFNDPSKPDLTQEFGSSKQAIEAITAYNGVKSMTMSKYF